MLSKCITIAALHVKQVHYYSCTTPLASQAVCTFQSVCLVLGGFSPKLVFPASVCQPSSLASPHCWKLLLLPRSLSWSRLSWSHWSLCLFSMANAVYHQVCEWLKPPHKDGLARHTSTSLHPEALRWTGWKEFSSVSDPGTSCAIACSSQHEASHQESKIAAPSGEKRNQQRSPLFFSFLFFS